MAEKSLRAALSDDAPISDGGPTLDIGPLLVVGPLDEYVGPREAVGGARSPGKALVRQYSAYAGPNTWGSWVNIGSYGGRVTYSVTYRGESGNTRVDGYIAYVTDNNPDKREPFTDSITITTGNVWGNLYVCFRGTPFGTAVTGTVQP